MGIERGSTGRSASKSDDELIKAARRQVFGAQFAPAPAVRLPKTVGPYRIIRQIGAGGMGVVYEAEQSQPTRYVALKVIRTPAGASPRYVHLFQREIEILARLRHPSIARIYDAGQTEEGQYYFAMELIEGESLTDYCEGAGLSLRKKLVLFAKVCEAVNYAHQRLVIHHDLKPANILVDHDGQPHILDFGLARFIDPDMDATRTLWGGGSMVGTLAYMSPEQTHMDIHEIDVRTDVYTLGVILYQMLTGEFPYGVVGHVGDVLRNIAETDPERPSLFHKMSNDVETIILRALAKDPDRRYPSAEALGQDIQRYLNGEPIEAKRDSTLYVIRKLAVRHYFHTSVILALVLSIMSFGGITYHALVRAKESADGLRTLNQQFETRNKNLERTVELARAKQDEQVLGWFLVQWHADCLKAARNTQQMMQPDSPEYMAASFLLDDSYAIEQLRNSVPAGASSLVLFVSGERHLKAGRIEEARQAFQQYTERYNDAWTPYVQERLEQLKPEEAGIRPGEPGHPPR